MGFHQRRKRSLSSFSCWVVALACWCTTHDPVLLATAAIARSDEASSRSARIKAHFDRQGFVVLRNVFSGTTNSGSNLEEWIDYERALFPHLFELLHDMGHTPFPEERRKRRTGGSGKGPSNHNHHHLDDSNGKGSSPYEYALRKGKHHGFREIVMRSPGRYDISLRHEMPPVPLPENNTTIATTTTTTMTESNQHDTPNEDGSTGGVLPQPSIDPILNLLADVVPSLVGSPGMAETNLHYGFVVSTPGAGEQQWHSDGEHLSLSEHLPCHCLNVFIPLANVTQGMGPTEFFPGSHYATRQKAPMKFSSTDLSEPRAPLLNVGDALVFDYRVLHRGLPNLADDHRPMLCLTVSEPGFVDTVNFLDRSFRDAPHLD